MLPLLHFYCILQPYPFFPTANNLQISFSSSFSNQSIYFPNLPCRSCKSTSHNFKVSLSSWLPSITYKDKIQSQCTFSGISYFHSSFPYGTCNFEFLASLEFTDLGYSSLMLGFPRDSGIWGRGFRPNLYVLEFGLRAGLLGREMGGKGSLGCCELAVHNSWLLPSVQSLF